ncbi:GGDEF domain-containing protein [Ruminococcus albus]|uniref:Diguanylate cyclase (GGDEF) domain-containing protein n=1 Tax=Ruminococcus albus TaxID=1264 RepID=A0A1I1NP96_RUMAL|nr:GGDEF domain-containing protein [Ruminococcus albus]SFC99246.1 diguanylate cyclase (GGDEF) domain-containing protein [Ruminococcus albus]
MNMNRTIKNTVLIEKLTLFFGGFLLFTDVFFLLVAICTDMPLMRYVVYVKLVINTTNIYLILKKHYLVSTVIICTVILGFMIVGLVCVGTEAAFQLFALGMLACISYSGYLHNRVLKKELPFVLMLAIHVAVYTGGYIYARTHEPLYDIPKLAVDILIAFNSAATFGIVLIYMVLFHNVAIRSEEKLEQMALIDNLTGLYNRHFLLTSMEHMEVGSPEDRWLAILDIDDFKKVNDTYGHNCGDYILKQISYITKKNCKDCIVCRWGGEEFIILSTIRNNEKDILESLRQKISEEEFSFENHKLHVTVTIGATHYESGLSNDGWISNSDEKLYYGKTHGKDQVVL